MINFNETGQSCVNEIEQRCVAIESWLFACQAADSVSFINAAQQVLAELASLSAKAHHMATLEMAAISIRVSALQ